MNTPSLQSTAVDVDSSRAPTRPRLAWVDGLRIVLTVLVVAHHAALTYSTIPLWYWMQSGSDASAVGLSLFVSVNQLWFMGAFFLLAGLFVPRSFDRKGPGRFIVDRLVRLGIPLLIFVVVLRPILMVPSALAQQTAAAQAGQPFSLTRAILLGGDPGPTWFLEVLLALSLVYAVVRLVRGDRGGSTGPVLVPTVPRALPFWGPVALVAVMALVTVLWRTVVPDGTYWPVVGLPSPAYLPQYAAMFVAGLVAARRGWLDGLRVRLVWPAVASLLAGLAAVFLTAGQPGAAALVIGAVGGALFSVGAVVTAMIICQRVLGGEPGPLRRFAAANAFAVYLIHPLVLVAWAAVLAPLPVPSAVHAAILLALALPTCWLVAAAIRRIPFLQRVL